MSNNHKTWSALRKAWRGYVIAKNKYEYDRLDYYASVIQKLQRELGLRVSLFPDIGLSASRSHLNNTEITQEEQEEEEQRLQHHSYEDEYFEGDFNNADRFTS